MVVPKEGARICAWMGIACLVGWIGCVPPIPAGYDWAKISASQEYEIGPDDILQIEVWGRPEWSKEIKVRPDGLIDLPLVGEVEAQGQTPEKLKRVLSSKMEAFEKNPTVTVVVKEVRSYKVYVLGKVAKPGVYQLTDKVTVLQALSLAGGFTPFAEPNGVVILRRKAGQEVRYPFVYDLVINGQVSEMNIILSSGDTVVIP